MCVWGAKKLSWWYKFITVRSKTWGVPYRREKFCPVAEHWAGCSEGLWSLLWGYSSILALCPRVQPAVTGAGIADLQRALPAPAIPWKTSQTLRCSFAFDQALCISATCDFSFLLQTYNQSQSNRRSIQKAISGNKMLHFYQHSPRMIPEGINPELHRMFITAEKYKPNDSGRLPKGRPSSLHHKSALFSCVTGKRIMVFSLSTPQAAISCCYLTAYEKCLLTWVWVSSRSALLAAVTFQLCYSALTLPSFPLTSSHHSSAFKGLSFRSDLCFILLRRASHRGNGWGSETWATKRRGKC